MAQQFDPVKDILKDIERLNQAIARFQAGWRRWDPFGPKSAPSNPGRFTGPGMKVETDAPLYYRHLTEREIEWRQRKHPLTLSDVAALGSHHGSFPIDEEGLEALVLSTPLEPAGKWGPHHKVRIGKWELGMSWDNKLVSRSKIRT